MLAAAVLELVGLHCHIGSQIFDTSGFEVGAHRVRRACWHAVRDEHGVELPELDLGGGLGIAYTSGRRPAEPADDRRSGCASIVDARVRRARARARRGSPSSRAGRSSGRATLTLYEVGTVKPLELDGGCDGRTSPSTAA